MVRSTSGAHRTETEAPARSTSYSAATIEGNFPVVVVVVVVVVVAAKPSNYVYTNVIPNLNAVTVAASLCVVHLPPGLPRILRGETSEYTAPYTPT